MAFLRRAATLAILSLGTSACALATFEGEYATTNCSFSGRTDHACGKCIAANCQALVDTCCSSKACAENEADELFGITIASRESALSLLDRCARGESCEAFELHPVPRDLATCIQSACGADCDLWRRSSLTAPETNCTVEGSGAARSCECRIPGTTGDAPRSANRVACNARSQNDYVCCASKDWPAAGAECTCRTAACLIYANACNCEPRPYISSSSQTTTSCGRGPCCITFDGQCRCDSSCDRTSVVASVQVCTPDAVFCGEGSRTVESCSAPAE